MADQEKLNKIVSEARQALDVAIATEKNNKRLIASIGPAVVQILKDTLVETIAEMQKPIMEKMSDMMEESLKTNQNDLKEALKNLSVNVEPNITVPEVKIPEIKVNVPKPEVTVKVPKNTDVVSAINEMSKAFSEQRPIDLEIPRYSLKEPMPVLITDVKGEPWTPFGSGAGGSRIVQYLNGDVPTNVSAANPLPTTASLSLGGSSIEVKQVSGFTDSVNVVGFQQSVGVSLLNGDGVTLDPRNRNWTITEGVEIKQISGFVNSVYVTGSMDSMLVYQARTTNPTPITDGNDIRASADDLGRQVMRPIQVRDLISTAYATISTGTETTLLSAAGAGVFSDLIYIMASNTSNAAVQVDVRSVTAGNVEFTIEVPASGTAGKSLPVPWPQGNANNNWTVDMGDFTNTTVYVSALFSKEV